MAKEKTIFICSECGAKYSSWQGKCNSCGNWNTLEAQTVSKKSGSVKQKADVKILSDFPISGYTERIHTGLSEFDMVLGGGIVPGSLILLGGDPGIGKSTLALQTALHVGKDALYVSGEESGSQVRMRSMRITEDASLSVMPETNLEAIVDTLSMTRPRLAIIDSIQTLYSENASGSSGGVAQVTYATNLLMRCAKANGIALIVIGHVTKEGTVAGPRTLEHMVDTVLYLEGERSGTLKLLRCVKNRFGSTGEVGIFELLDTGLKEVKNPSAYLLGNREKMYSGICRAAVLEGNKVLLTEIEALTSPVAFGYPQRKTSGFDQNRLQLICAILQKRLGVSLQNHDVFLNVAGGFTIDERAADLPAALAIISSLYNQALPNDLVAFGEIALSGEIRPGTQVEKRVRECLKLELKTIVGNFTGKKMADASVVTIKEIQDVKKVLKKEGGKDRSID